MTSTERRFHKDFANVSALVEPYAVAFDDGFVGLVGAPAETERLYSALRSVGYANGWL